MKDYLERDHVQALGYTLETLFNEAMDEDDIAESIEDMSEQWRGTPEYARTIREHWQGVLNERDPAVAQYLIQDWAKQGKFAPEEAIEQLQTWYDQLQPLWSELDEH